MMISFYNPSISSNTPRRITLIIPPPPPSLPLSIIYSHTQTSSRKKLISRFVFLFQVSDHDLITRRASPRPSLSFTQARTPMYTFDCFICASRAVRTLKRRLYTNPRQKESFASLSLTHATMETPVDLRGDAPFLPRRKRRAWCICTRLFSHVHVYYSRRLELVLLPRKKERKGECVSESRALRLDDITIIE